MDEPEMVLVVWVDALLPDSTWVAIADVDLEMPTVRTVGWLVGHSDIAYAIAQDVDLYNGHVHMCGLIPKKTVVSMHRLAIADDAARAPAIPT